LKKILITICTFKEDENIKALIDEIRKYQEKTDILIVNDSPEDNTKKILDEIKDKNIYLIERKSKLGLGSAHMLCLIYAIKNRYDFVVSMDADFSHDPKYLPNLIDLSEKGNFVIGSRFCQGGSSEYKGLRKYISLLGNKFTAFMLKLHLKEVTTYFRVYDVSKLMHIPFNQIKREGYSMGVKLIWFLKKLDTQLVETPIHFYDRKKGESKLPKLQIFISAIDVFILKFIDLFFENEISSCNSYLYDNPCTLCKKNIFVKIDEKNKFKCLTCFHIQDNESI
jgi:dolichol-phosphate mannosyltransferase